MIFSIFLSPCLNALQVETLQIHIVAFFVYVFLFLHIFFSIINIVWFTKQIFSQ